MHTIKDSSADQWLQFKSTKTASNLWYGVKNKTAGNQRTVIDWCESTMSNFGKSSCFLRGSTDAFLVN